MMWNPWHGCHKISEACENCYVFAFDKKREINSSIVRKTKDFNLPIKKDRNGKYKVQSGCELQVCLTSDFFIQEADIWRKDIWDMMRFRQDISFLLFTKRVDRIKDCLPVDWGEGYENVSINLTTENQKRVNERLPIYLDLPIKHRGVLVSPCLEKVDISQFLQTGKIDYVFASGENYENARVCDFEWIKSLSEQCKKFNVSFCFFHTGSVFKKDGKIYKIPYKLGKSQAKKANVDVFGNYEIKNR